MIREVLIFVSIVIASVHSAHFKVTSEVNLDITIDNKPIGSITIGLFGYDAPKTVENFQTICRQGINGQSYNGTSFHRVIDRFIIQGGDIVSNDGRGTTSIYGKYFEDENLTIDHTGPGFLGMANKGPNKNGCQFYITTMQSPWLNGKHTIFGKVVKGNSYVHVIEKTPTDGDRKPTKDIRIATCTEEPVSRGFYWISDNPYDLYAWVRATAIPVGFSLCVLTIFRIFIRKLDKISEEDPDEDEKNK